MVAMRPVSVGLWESELLPMSEIEKKVERTYPRREGFVLLSLGEDIQRTQDNIPSETIWRTSGVRWEIELDGN